MTFVSLSILFCTNISIQSYGSSVYLGHLSVPRPSKNYSDTWQLLTLAPSLQIPHRLFTAITPPKLVQFQSIMRLRNREVTPSNPANTHANSVTRARFYHAWDHKDDFARVSARLLFKQFNVSKSTVYDWLRERREIGDKSNRRRDGRIEKQLLRGAPGPGRPRKIPLELCQIQVCDRDDR
jgi:hypothetical protein